MPRPLYKDLEPNLAIRMPHEEMELIYSALNKKVELDGHVLDVQIYRSEDSDWLLEVVNEKGTSIVWDDQFESDKLAWQAFESCLKEEGISAFK